MQLSYSYGGGVSLPPGTFPDPPVRERKPDPGPSLCQLCTNWSATLFPVGDAIIEEKHDGIRALWIRDALVSRNGLPLVAAQDLEPILRVLESRFGEPMMFDCEYVEAGGIDATLATWRRPGGKGTLHIFDAVPLRVWDGYEDGPTLIDRKIRFADIMAVSEVTAGDLRIELAQWQSCPDADFAESMAQDVWARGGEGVVVKRASGRYQCRRSRDWLRLKQTITYDMVVDDVKPMKDDPDALGAIGVRFGNRKCWVHAGFTDKERRILWAIRDQVIGRIAEIACMGATATGALRSGRFLRWRTDKSGSA